MELTAAGQILVNGVPLRPPPRACVEPPGSAVDESAAATATPERSAVGKATVRSVPLGALFVLGDCPPRSTDSRSWGPLDEGLVVARPVVRVWPPNRQGAIDDSVDLNPFRRLMLQEPREDAGVFPRARGPL